MLSTNGAVKKAWFDCSHRTLRSLCSRSPWQFCHPACPER